MLLRGVAAAIALAACAGGTREPDHHGPDPHSDAQPQRVAVEHLDLDLTVDFTTKRLTGTAKLRLKRTDPTAPVVLDADGLTISAITDCDGKAARYRDKPLRIETTASCVVIAYHTAPEAGAMLWVEPAGTAGGKVPMLFTQSEATRARTWIPLQDSPSVRFTYDATIRPPAGMWALMSAENPTAPPADGVWRFKQPHPIPSYLMALAVGDFAYRQIGPRSGVYAEPSVVDAAASEFSEVEAMMTTAEQLYGPYRWGHYDMLVLPPSFPFGGMENPNLTFLTPTVITGDRALVSLIAHELAHSWSGNLATNSTWNDKWLNEGFTTYVENRVMEQLRGREYGDVQWFMHGQTIYRELFEAGPMSPTTRLAHDLGRGTDPEDIPDDLIYDKGSVFLRTLEFAYGRDKFDAFLRGWFDRHAFQAVTTKQFITEATAELGTKVDLEAWIYGTGFPSDAAPTTSARATALAAIARDFIADGRLFDASSWTTLDWTLFLRALPDQPPVERLRAIDARFTLTTTTNSEISMFWLPIVIKADERSAMPAISAFLMRVGRARMVRPVYRALAEGGPHWQALGRDVFRDAAPKYHPVTRESVEKILAPR